MFFTIRHAGQLAAFFVVGGGFAIVAQWSESTSCAEARATCRDAGSIPVGGTSERVKPSEGNATNNRDSAEAIGSLEAVLSRAVRESGLLREVV